MRWSVLCVTIICAFTSFVYLCTHRELKSKSNIQQSYLSWLVDFVLGWQFRDMRCNVRFEETIHVDTWFYCIYATISCIYIFLIWNLNWCMWFESGVDFYFGYFCIWLILNVIAMEVSRTNVNAVQIILDLTVDRQKHLLVLIVQQHATFYIVGCIRDCCVDFVLG